MISAFLWMFGSVLGLGCGIAATGVIGSVSLIIAAWCAMKAMRILDGNSKLSDATDSSRDTTDKPKA